MNNQFDKYSSIPKEKFNLAAERDRKHDAKLDTKPVSYMRDALRRFAKNKASVVAAYIILALVLFAIIGPYCCSASYQAAYETDTGMLRYQYLLPKLFPAGFGFWDGTQVKEINEITYYKYMAMEQETGNKVIVKIIDQYEVNGSKMYKVRIDSYTAIDNYEVTLTLEQYQKLQEWQDETGIQVILPRVNRTIPSANSPQANIYEYPYCASKDGSIWYASSKQSGIPTLDEYGNLIPAYYTSGKDMYTSEMRIEGDPGLLALARVADIEDEEARQTALSSDPDWIGRWRYAGVTGSSQLGISYVVRVNQYNYFQYLYDMEPYFLFGTNASGYDIFSRLAKGARFSFMLAICVSAINLTIGAIYGAIEGYYGGTTDMVMERVSDILSGIPTMVVTVLFQLHLAAKVGVVGALIYAFVLTGWIGMASSTRMQFYRYKNQEYVLAARTLGANDWRIIWKHIFPNSLGTLITGCVLVIPGVIFSETSLTYLGIINLDSPTMSSIGSMLAAGQEGGAMTRYPHVIFFPALFIALLMICFNLFGNGLRDAFNPSLRGVEE